MSSPWSWHGSWRRLAPGEGLGMVERVQLGVGARGPAPPPAVVKPTPARASQVAVVSLAADAPGDPPSRPCGRMWLGG